MLWNTVLTQAYHFSHLAGSSLASRGSGFALSTITSSYRFSQVILCTMQLPATPPAGTPPPDADGFYTLPEIPTEMTHGSIYLPYRLTPYQQAWNIFGFFQTLTAFLLSLFFLYIARRVPLTSAKVLVLCIIYLDLLSIGDTCIRHATAWGFGYFPGGFYTCQVQGFINGIWGAGAQSAALAFTFERYLLIVSWQEGALVFIGV